MTPGQERAFQQFWPCYGVDYHGDLEISSPAIFSNQQPLALEIGFGMGDSLLQMAGENPDWNFIGVEVHRPGVGRILHGLAEKNLHNLKVLRWDAVEVLEHVGENQLQRVQIYFPDPWPKARHHKRRLIQRPFIDRLHGKLARGGELHCATDWENYGQHIADVLLSDGRFENLGNEQGFAPRPSFRPETKFERRGLNLGHGVWDLRFIKK